MLSKLRLSTPKEGFIKITRDVESLVAESGVKEGICVVFCPHTTAGITINENADPDVVRDLTYAMNITSPDRPEYRHAEGNSHAHMKALMTGVSPLSSAAESSCWEDGRAYILPSTTVPAAERSL